MSRSRPTSHLCLILNGKRAGDPALRELVQARRREGDRIEVRVTWEQGDAARYTREAVDDGVHCVVAAGGDGTLGAVAGALAGCAVDGRAVPDLALLPLGTANDFATAAGLPDTLEAAFDIASRPAVPIDMLRVHVGSRTHWCINVATGGFGTQATEDVREGTKKALGPLAYLLSGVRAVRRHEPVEVEVRGPGLRWTGAMLALALGNARLAGGGHPLCPDALIDDGLLDVTVVPQVPELPTGLAGVVRTAIRAGREAAIDEAAERARVPWVEILADGPIDLHLDGEPCAGERVRIDCIAGLLRMRLPSGCPLLATHAGADRADLREPL